MRLRHPVSALRSFDSSARRVAVADGRHRVERVRDCSFAAGRGHSGVAGVVPAAYAPVVSGRARPAASTTRCRRPARAHGPRATIGASRHEPRTAPRPSRPVEGPDTAATKCGRRVPSTGSSRVWRRDALDRQAQMPVSGRVPSRRHRAPREDAATDRPRSRPRWAGRSGHGARGSRRRRPRCRLKPSASTARALRQRTTVAPRLPPRDCRETASLAAPFRGGLRATWQAACGRHLGKLHRRTVRPARTPSCPGRGAHATTHGGGPGGLIPLPERAEKPRRTGVTHVVDPGLTCVEAAGLMELASNHVDVVRLGWGSAMVTAGAGGQARDLPRSRRRPDARRDADRAGVAPRADRPAARGAAAARDPPCRGLRGHAGPAGRRQAAPDPDARAGLHGVRRGRQQGRAARAGVGAVGAPGERGAGRRRARDRLRGPRVRGRRALLAGRLDPRRAGGRARGRGRARTVDLRGSAPLAAGVARTSFRLGRRPGATSSRTT